MVVQGIGGARGRELELRGNGGCERQKGGRGRVMVLRGNGRGERHK